MPKPLVLWRLDVQDDYVHTSAHCPEIEAARRVQCGTIEEAQASGHVRACQYCRNHTETGIHTVFVEQQTGPKSPKMMQKDTAVFFIVLSLMVGLSVGLFVFSNQDEWTSPSVNLENYVTKEELEKQKKESYNSGYQAGYSAGKLRVSSAPTSTPYSNSQKSEFTAFHVTATTEIISNDHVGNDWYYYFEADENALPSTLYAKPGDTISLYAQATENDSIPDVGECKSKVTVKDDYIEYGFYATDYVYVYETSGRYAGNEAVIKVTWDFEPK